MSALTLRKVTISTRTNLTLQTSVRKLRAIKIGSSIIPECGYDNSTFILFGDAYCPNTKCSGKLCLNKKTIKSLGRSDFQRPQCASVCQVRKVPFKDQTNSFFLSSGQGLYVFEESPKSIQNVIRDGDCAGQYCLNREKCESLDGYVTIPRLRCSC